MNNILSLCSLSAMDVNHLDALPIAPNEKRHKACKTLADIKWVYCYIQGLTEARSQFQAGKLKAESGAALNSVATAENCLLSPNNSRSKMKWTVTVS